MAEVKVGGEVDAWCTRCKLVLAHTVLALWGGKIQKVRCNTCMGEHSSRAAEPGSGGPRRPRVEGVDAPTKSLPGTSAYKTLLAGKDRASARRWDVSEKFFAGDLVEHPTFGLGVVAAVRGPDKIDVVFPDTVKTLAHNRTAARALARPPARPAREAVDERHEPDPTADTSDEPEGTLVE
jgi:hypothetical protein